MRSKRSSRLLPITVETRLRWTTDLSRHIVAEFGLLLFPSMRARHIFIASLVFGVGLFGFQSHLVSQEEAHSAGSQVPFVGCESDGQVGPLTAPHRAAKKLMISPELASRFAYYEAEDGFGVLAPRGWHCFSTYGSNGSNLYVTPETTILRQLERDVAASERANGR
jgi:hypothetical protein